MADENFEPIRLNAKAPGGERVLKSFDDIGAFILMRVETNFRKLPWWQAVLKDLPQARLAPAKGDACGDARCIVGRGMVGRVMQPENLPLFTPARKIVD
jgi:hypothetical protein